MNSVVLVCAAVAALGLGVLLAYGCCIAGFALLRAHARSLAGPEEQQGEPQVARVS